MIQPSKEFFIETLKQSGILPLYEEVTFTPPCQVYESFAQPESFLLESVKGPDKIARYSLIGFNPCLVFKTKDGINEITCSGISTVVSGPPLSIMRGFADLYHQIPFDVLPPFQGGLCGMLSYDFAQYLEEVPHNAMDDLFLPDAHFFIVDKLIAFDHLLRKAWIICCPGVEASLKSIRNIDWKEKYEEAECQIQEIKNILSRNLACEEGRLSGLSARVEIKYEMKKRDYIDIVKKAKDYIAAGDIFQANLSQRLSALINATKPLHLYKRLRTINPSPFACFLDFGAYQIVSSSPERLVRIKDGIVETRPIAGTRPRGEERKRGRSNAFRSSSEREGEGGAYYAYRP